MWNLKLPASVAVGLLGAVAPPTLGQAEAVAPGLSSFLAPGPHRVSHSVVFLNAPDRPFFSNSPEAGRPIRLYIWGPTDGGEGETIRWGEYLEPTTDLDGARTLNEALQKRDLSTARRQFASDADGVLFDSLATAPTLARRDAPIVGDALPLVVHSLGRNDYQLESTVLWEWLASHGYVVVVPAQVGPSGDDFGISFDAAHLTEQIRDMEAAIVYAVQSLPVDANRIGLLGHSSGGMCAAWLAANDARVRAVVALDPSVYADEERALFKEIAGDGTTDAALLNLHRERDKDRTTLDASAFEEFFRGPIVDVAFEPALHFDFQNWPLYAVLTGVVDERSGAYRSSAIGAETFLGSCRATKAFLDRALSVDSDVRAEDMAKSVDAELPEHGSLLVGGGGPAD